MLPQNKKVLGLDTWVHVILTIISSGLWLIVYLICKSNMEQEAVKKMLLEMYLKNNSNVQIDNNKENNLIYTGNFNVTGISFHNKELKRIIKNGLETKNIEKFQGMTRKEKVEYCEYNDGLSEYSEQNIDVHLNKTTFKDNPAIEVIADDFYGNDVLIGYVPKEEIENLINYLDKNILIWATIVGGKTYYFDEYKENDEYEELELGVNLLIKIYQK